MVTSLLKSVQQNVFRYGYVCADYCQEIDDKSYEWCWHVYWDYNYTTNEATLVPTWDYCKGHVPPGFEGWEIALIVLGVVAGVVLFAAGCAWCLHSPYCNDR